MYGKLTDAKNVRRFSVVCAHNFQMCLFFVLHCGFAYLYAFLHVFVHFVTLFEHLKKNCLLNVLYELFI